MTIPSPAPRCRHPASIYRHPGFLAFISARLMAVFDRRYRPWWWQAPVQVYDLTRDPLRTRARHRAGGLCRRAWWGWTLGFKQLRTVDRFEEAANAH